MELLAILQFEVAKLAELAKIDGSLLSPLVLIQ